MSHPTPSGPTLDELEARLGEPLLTSDWVPVDQRKLDDHARTSGDEDWLHNDPERAAAESPFGTTIAQGSLLLSMVVGFANHIPPFASDIAYILNYGFERVRFVRPVPIGARVRGRYELAGVRARPDGRWIVRIACTLEQEGEEQPAVVAELLGLVTRA